MVIAKNSWWEDSCGLPLEKNTNNGIGQRLEESLSLLLLPWSVWDLPRVPYAQPQLVSLGAALCFCRLSSGNDYNGTITQVPHEVWLALTTPILSQQGWLGLFWPGDKTVSTGRLSCVTEPLYSSVTARHVLAQLACRQPNKLHQVQISSFIDIFQYPHSLGFPTEFYLCFH